MKERISFVPHLLETLPGLDPQWRLAGGLVAAADSGGRSPADRLAGSPGGWLVFSGKKRGSAVGIGRKGKGTTLYILTDGNNLPLGVHLAGADRHESTQVVPLVDRAVISWGHWPKRVRLIYDKAADSDPLRERLRSRCIRLICPHKSNRKVQKPLTESQRKWYARRWQIERSISWLQKFRRLVVRYEYHADLFLGMAQLACLFTILQRF